MSARQEPEQLPSQEPEQLAVTVPPHSPVQVPSHSPMQLPSASVALQVPSHCPVQVPVQELDIEPVQLPSHMASQDPVQLALAATVQLPSQEPEQPPLSCPPSHVGGVAVASKLTSHSAAHWTMASKLAVHRGGANCTVRVAEAFAAKTPSIASAAFVQAVAVS